MRWVFRPIQSNIDSEIGCSLEVKLIRKTSDPGKQKNHPHSGGDSRIVFTGVCEYFFIVIVRQKNFGALREKMPVGAC